MKHTSLLLSIALSTLAHADIQLPSVLSDHMVLQRGMALPFWGKATGNLIVTVDAVDGTGKILCSAKTQAGTNGKFMAQLPEMSATKDPITIKISCGSDVVVLQDVLVGEVWLCGGQSNMEWKVAGCTGATEFAATLPSTVRSFTPPHAMAARPLDDLSTKWVIATPEATMGFTAVGGWFAANIGSTLDVPVGILSINWGGTLAEPWTPIDLAQGHPMFAGIIAKQQAAGVAFEQLASEKADSVVDDATPTSTVKAPAPSADPAHPLAQSSVFGSKWNAMIAPVVPFGIRGALWYQGESNADRADQYRELLPLMIESWRVRWNEGDFPFGIVQLANFRAPSEDPVEGQWSALRDAQLNTSRVVPNCGLAVTIDVGDADDIHPRNKQAVADRLAVWALSQVYARGGEWSGPLYEKSEVQGSAIKITFAHAEGLGGAKGAPVGGFAIAGSDGRFHWANAKVSGTTVTVSSPEVANPTVVRYAWSSNPTRANLVNEAGLPASPFATDRPMTKPIR